jgi:hypothetical protein
LASKFAFLRFEDVALEGETKSARLALMVPTLIAAAMLVVGFTTANIAGVRAARIILPYLEASFLFTAFSLTAYIFVSFVALFRQLAANPVSRVYADLKIKAPYLLLPLLVFPLFLVGYTAAKTGIPFLVGYSWDAFWTAADKQIFGDDAWRITHALLGTRYIAVWEVLYTFVWGSAFVLFMTNVAIYGRPKFIGIVYTTMLSAWCLGGWLLAYIFSAAGPTFAHLVDPQVGAHFAPLRNTLENALPEMSRTRLTQRMLSVAIEWNVAIKGGGISAMPSMHLAAVSVYVLAARGTKWLFPAVAFWLMIFTCSAYLGWHYWVDGIASAAITWMCWRFAERCFREDPTQALATGGAGEI